MLKSLPYKATLLACLFWATTTDVPAQVDCTECAEVFTQNLHRYLIKDDTLLQWLHISEKGIFIFASPEQKGSGQPEFVLYWNELDSMRHLIRHLAEDSLLSFYQHKGTTPLNPANRSIAIKPPVKKDFTPMDVRIAIDPGHTGGDEALARMEKKYMRMRPGAVPGYDREIAFNEGNLAMATAFVLADSLRARGFSVMLTRPGYGLTAFGIPYDEWLATEYPAALQMYIRDQEMTPKEEEAIRAKTRPDQIFHSVFKYAEFKERARLIRTFQPSITLAIHYNVNEKNVSDAAGFYRPVADNFSMCFVPGAWAAGELDDARWRMQFLMDLIDDENQNSLKLSASVENHLASDLGVPPMPFDTAVGYLRNYSIDAGVPGVFCRNLAFNRLLSGAMCFGETLFQDNLRECVALNEKRVNYHGWLGPTRVGEAANAYYLGIMDYLYKD